MKHLGLALMRESIDRSLSWEFRAGVKSKTGELQVQIWPQWKAFHATLGDENCSIKQLRAGCATRQFDEVASCADTKEAKFRKRCLSSPPCNIGDMFAHQPFEFYVRLCSSCSRRCRTTGKLVDMP